MSTELNKRSLYKSNLVLMTRVTYRASMKLMTSLSLEMVHVKYLSNNAMYSFSSLLSKYCVFLRLDPTTEIWLLFYLGRPHYTTSVEGRVRNLQIRIIM